MEVVFTLKHMTSNIQVSRIARYNNNPGPVNKQVSCSPMCWARSRNEPVIFAFSSSRDYSSETAGGYLSVPCKSHKIAEKQTKET